MKKLLLVATILAGVASAAHAGVNFSFGIGIPLPPPPFVISRPAPDYCPPPVVVAPRYYPPPVVIERRPHWDHYRHEPRGRTYRYAEHWRGPGREHYVHRERWSEHRR